VVSLSNH
jgi:hypothetical protein